MNIAKFNLNRSYKAITPFINRNSIFNIRRCYGSSLEGLKSDSVAGIDQTSYLKILNVMSEKSDKFMNCINKCKNELQKLSTESYPFKKHELYTLIELLSNVLTLQSKDDAKILALFLKEFRNNTSFTASIELCKVFSGNNNCYSKLPSSLLTRFFYNQIGLIGARFLAPKSMDTLNNKYREGVRYALTSLADSITNQDFNSLESCCDSKLYKFLRDGIEYLNSLKLKIKYNMLVVEAVQLDKFLITIGGKRNDSFRGLYIFKEAIAHQIIISQPKNMAENEDLAKNREVVYKTFKRGIILRMEVLVRVQQSLSLNDETNSVWMDPNPICTHRLCFESELKLDDSEQNIKFNSTDWSLVDINGVLNNNNPLN